MKEILDRLAQRREEARIGGGQGRIDAQHIRQRLWSWLGHVGYADSHRIVERLLEETPFVRRVTPPEAP